jgi:tRNA U34 2-thiouridine synthase MnmA/TrmU
MEQYLLYQERNKQLEKWLFEAHGLTKDDIANAAKTLKEDAEKAAKNQQTQNPPAPPTAPVAS